MADILLNSDESLLNSPFTNSRYFGNAGKEAVGLTDTAKGSVVSQTVETVTFAGTSASYTYQQSGNQLVVFQGGVEFARITVQNDADGTAINFANGATTVKVSAAGMVLGSGTVPAAAPGAVDPGLTPGGGAGNTITLTSAVDLVNPTQSNALLRTTSGNDLIVGVATSEFVVIQSNVQTFGGLDDIDGGDGNDTLRLNNPGDPAFTGFNLPAGTTVKNVENLEIVNANGGSALNANVSTWAGLKNVSVDQRVNENVNITTKANATAVTIKGGAAVNVNDSGLGTADTLAAVTLVQTTGNAAIVSEALTSLTLAGLQTNGQFIGVTNNTTGGHALALTLAGTGSPTANVIVSDQTATSINVTATAANSSNVSLSYDAATSVTFAGDKTVSVGLFDQGLNVATVGAITSTNTAGVTITTGLANTTSFTGGTGKDAVTITNGNTKAINTGAGDDKVTVTGTALGAGGTIDGGDGVDTLHFTNATDAAGLAGGYSDRIANFEKLSLGQIAGGTTPSISLDNFDGISYIVAAGTAATTGTAEVQTITFGPDAGNLNGGILVVGGVSITVPSGATALQVANLVVAQEAALKLGDPNIVSVTSGGTPGQVVVTYTTTSGDIAPITIVDNPSNVTFGAVVETNGTNEVREVQTITVGTAPSATGVFSIGGVAVNVVLGESTIQTAQRIYDALNTTKPSGVASVAYTVGTNVVSVTFTSAAGNAAALVVADPGDVFAGATDPVVADNATAYVAPVAESQAFTITGAADATGGEIEVGGVRIVIPANATIDQIGSLIAANAANISTVNPNVTGVNYNTATDTVTVTYAQAAGNVVPVVVRDNTSSASFGVAETTKGIAGTAAGTLALTNFANNGTLELTGAINGLSSVSLKDPSGSADVFNLKLNGSGAITNTAALALAGVETINIETADSNALANPAGPATVILNDASATTINITGNHGVTLGGVLSNVTTVNASGVVSTGVDPLTNAGNPNQVGQTGAVFFASQVTNKAVSVTTGNGNDVIITASTNAGATISTGAGDDTVIGSSGKDTIDLGAGNDIVGSSAGTDTITLGAGNDIYVLQNTTHSTINARQVITDFQANTIGQGAGGAATSAGAISAVAARNGDVINIDGVNGGLTEIRFAVLTNAADATTFVANGDLDGLARVNAALDSSTGNVYLDVNDDGVADSVIQLTGITTLTTAAFVIA